MSLKIGILGQRAAAYIDGMRSIPGIEIVAVCDTADQVAERTAIANSVPAWIRNLDQMLDRVDAIVVGTPMHLHAPHSIQAMEAGKHVLSEVTAAVSLDECRQLVEAVRRTGATYMMSENYCYFRENVLVREMARKGLFGELYYGEGEYLHDVKSMHHHADGSPTWRSEWQVGKNGNTYPTHSLGPVMQWFWTMDPADRAETVVCMGSGRRTDPEHPHDDTTITLVQMRSGKLIRLRLDMMSNRPAQVGYYSLQGTSGVYESSRVAGQTGHVWLGKNPPAGAVVHEERSWAPLSEFEDHLPREFRELEDEAANAGHGGSDFYVGRAFVETLLGRQANPIDVSVATHWTAVGLCSEMSIANGGVPVQVPDFSSAGGVA